MMTASSDRILLALDDVAGSGSAAAFVRDTLERVRRRLDDSREQMGWDVVPLNAFGDRLPANIRSCWIFVIRASAETSAERHPNSHQRSLSLTGAGAFELYESDGWTRHVLVSDSAASVDERWVTIPPATWHRLVVGEHPWGMLSFHTVAPDELIEEKPVNPEELRGPTHQERYAEKGL